MRSYDFLCDFHNRPPKAHVERTIEQARKMLTFIMKTSPLFLTEVEKGIKAFQDWRQEGEGPNAPWYLWACLLIPLLVLCLFPFAVLMLFQAVPSTA